MDKTSVFYRQVSLLLRVLPAVATEAVFALKGGTAINLFVRNFPRLSVDIDLAYLPLESRQLALQNAQAALQRISDQINRIPGLQAVLQCHREDELRIIVSTLAATIKIEVSPVARGVLHEPILTAVSEAVEDEFGFAQIAVVSLPDLYGGKLCAALDRQHPRDLFDVHQLLQFEGINRELFTGFLTYLLSHPRPLHELLSPRWKAIQDVYQKEFAGMTLIPVGVEELIDARERMLTALQQQLTSQDVDFLVSFKRGEPDWSLCFEPKIAELPAVRWKLQNIHLLKKNPLKHQQALHKLELVLQQWLSQPSL